MATRRQGPVGLGYLPKGGRAAGAAHNARIPVQPLDREVQEAAAASVAVPVVEPVASVPERGGRARRRAAALLGTESLARLGAVAGSVALLVEVVRWS